MIGFLIAAVSLTPNIQAAILDGIRYELRDPDSATFRNFRANAKGDFCVEVNARNGYGGYTGYQTWAGHVGSHKTKLKPPNGWGEGVRQIECEDDGVQAL
jgi:hypothetical protein